MSVLVEQLKGNGQVIAAELRPPRAELETAARMDAWIDTYHAVRGLTREGNLRLPDRQRGRVEGRRQPPPSGHHLGTDVPRAHVVPFLTCKHTPEFCLAYADRARHNGFDRSSCSAATRRRASAMRRARLAAPRDYPLARCRSGARRVGQPPLGRRDAGAVSVRRPGDRGVLSDPDRLALQPRGGRALSRRSGAAPPGSARHVRRVLLPFRESENAATP